MPVTSNVVGLIEIEADNQPADSRDPDANLGGDLQRLSRSALRPSSIRGSSARQSTRVAATWSETHTVYADVNALAADLHIELKHFLQRLRKSPSPGRAPK